MLNILPITLLLSFSNCKKEPPKPAEPKVEKTPVVWYYDVERNEGSGIYSAPNYIYSNQLIQCMDSKDGKTVVYCMTLDSGKIVWQNDEIPFPSPFRAVDTDLSENYLVLTSNQKLCVLDLNNGNIVLSVDVIGSRNIIKVINHKIYISTTNPKGAILKVIDINSGVTKDVFSLLKDDLDNYAPTLTAPAFWQHPNGDEILIMGNRSYNGQVAQYDRYDMLAYNLTADTMLWYKKGTPGIRGSIASPLVQDNKAVFYVERNVECLNPLNGETIWTHTRHLADNFSAYKSGNITSLGNIVIAKPDSDYMYGVDINTGNTLWSNPKTATMPYTIRIAMDKVWYGSGGVNCIDASTGKTLIDKWRYQNKGSWMNPITVDENTGYIYTTADGVIYCLDANMLMEE
ncbi:MAG: PQQ-binding-like beta-propeller repeat protein [Bacteroidetes bacterium]|nr:PQQ-binding-like beta-propeller repeat protein [Bacteroidota bacterium]